jgi:hypothetical protein
VNDKQRVYSIPSVEKTTSWTIRELSERDIALQKAGTSPLRDTELDAAIARTAEIKTLMSPPGALGLPELLDQQRLRWGIPDGAFECRAIFDRIHIFPVDFAGDSETALPGGAIITPESTKQRSIQNAHRGVLISMGLTAADHCVSHGVELGHIVRTIRNAPHAQECARLKCNGKSMFYLVMRDGDLTGSETQEEDVRSGKTRIVEEGGSHSYCFNIDGKKKQVSLVRDQW